MNNFVDVEKTLKRWMKSRVKITTATIIGFLIMGMTAFAVEPVEIGGKEDTAEKIFDVSNSDYLISNGPTVLTGGSFNGADTLAGKAELTITNKKGLQIKEGSKNNPKKVELSNFNIILKDGAKITFQDDTSVGASHLTLNNSVITGSDSEDFVIDVINREPGTEGSDRNILTLNNSTIYGGVAVGYLEGSNATITKDVSVYRLKAENFHIMGDVDVSDSFSTSGTSIYEGNVSSNGDFYTSGTSIFKQDVNISTRYNAICLGDTYFNKNVEFKKLTIGNDRASADIEIGEGRVFFSSDSQLKLDKGLSGNGELSITEGSEAIIQVAERDIETGKYISAFKTEKGREEDKKIDITGEGKVTVDTSKVTGLTSLIDASGVEFGTDIELNTTSELYSVRENSDGDLRLIYDKDYFKDNVLDSISTAAAASGARIYLSDNADELKGQIDKLYSSNIYSETVKASYDILKLNEDTILDMKTTPKTGELTVYGNALYSKKEHDRDGKTGTVTSENEITGLLANAVYGIKDNSAIGFVFSGAQQDIDTDGGNAEGDVFYLGLYKNIQFKNMRVTAGLEYQFGDFDTNNTAGNETTTASYNSETLGVYAQTVFTKDLGNNLFIEPKVKAGITHIEQDEVEDAYFGVKDAEITTADITVGADLRKIVQFENSAADFKAGIAYTHTMGDIDKEFTGIMYGELGRENFQVLGAEIAENVFTLNMGMELSHDNGFFYNGGFAYQFGSDNKSYSINIGVGYKF